MQVLSTLALAPEALLVNASHCPCRTTAATLNQYRSLIVEQLEQHRKCGAATHHGEADEQLMYSCKRSHFLGLGDSWKVVTLRSRFLESCQEAVLA